MDDAIMPILLIVVIMGIIAVLTTKQQQDSVERFSWSKKDSRVKDILFPYRYDAAVKYPGLGDNYANYCRAYANLDACRWSPEFRNNYCVNECVEGRSMNCFEGSDGLNNETSRYEKAPFPTNRNNCRYDNMDNRGRIDKCKTKLLKFKKKQNPVSALLHDYKRCTEAV